MTASDARSKDVEGRILRLIADATGGNFRAEDLRPEQTLVGHLGLASLAMMVIVFRFEEEFGVSMDNVTLDPAMFRTVGSVVEKGRELLQASGLA